MNPVKEFKLIEGTFSPEEANQVLGAMVKSKINYHSIEKHSHSELSGGNSANSEERLRYLHDLNAQLKKLFETAAAENKRLKISGNIVINLVD